MEIKLVIVYNLIQQTLVSM